MSESTRNPISPETLRLPFCETPRPGDRVVWYQDALRLHGTLLGHKPDGKPSVFNDFGGVSQLPSFDYLRLEDIENRLGPIWERLPTNAQIVRPLGEESNELKALLDQTTPPGPRYIDLVTEIWSRGYEIFVVGGTVRDVISKTPTKDVDLVTTMPLAKARPLVNSMYRQYNTLPKAALLNGHLRLGGALGSTDPFIDLCVFKHQLPGTVDAIFGGDFERDVGHRDFACNSVYYDPINDVLIDPSGRGILDAQNKTLSLVCDQKMRSQHHVGQVVIRFFKFLCRGYSPADPCVVEIRHVINPSLTAMATSIRVSYIRTQLLGKYPPSEHARQFAEFERQFIEFGAEEIWKQLIEPLREEILHE